MQETFVKEKKKPVNLVWIKRDIRTQDHAALEAAEQAQLPYLIVYLFEPSLLAYPDSSLRHQQFIYNSLADANKTLHFFNRSIQIFYVEAPLFFEFILNHFDLKSVYSYQESGIKLTWNRDRKVTEILKKNNVYWHQFQKGGVIRGMNNRKNWDRVWLKDIAIPPIKNVFTQNEQPPFNHPFSLPPTLASKFLEVTPPLQAAGETQAWKYLISFTHDRGKNYHKMISKPLESRKSCGRISPYLSWGNLSIKQAMYHVSDHADFEKHKRAFGGLMTRLKWHCHFIQKFEVECDYEILCVNRGYESLVRVENNNYLLAWQSGRTGFPLVDACMRCLHTTGWINFRMRAMLVSLLCHHLDQDWRTGVYHLAQLFLDYEPGIHYPQFQMQAGTTGINTVRIYNPIKQSYEHDPEGIFIKKWVPELINVPIPFIHEPYKMNHFDQSCYGIEMGVDYPFPIVNLEESGKIAREKIWGHRKGQKVKKESQRILKTHVRKQ
jgi:deoxyribodipyrimidine photo-lyase